MPIQIMPGGPPRFFHLLHENYTRAVSRIRNFLCYRCCYVSPTQSMPPSRRICFCFCLLFLIGFPALTRAASCFLAPTNMLGWWPGDGSAVDIVGTNNGVLQGGAAASVAGVAGSAFGFDGTNGFVAIPNSAVLRPTNFTIEAWVRFTGLDSAGSGGSPAGDQYIIFRQNTRSSDFEGFDLSKTRVAGSDVFRFLISSATAQTAEIHSSTTISTGVWYHVAAVRGSNFTQIYVNGVLERQTNVTFQQDYGNFPLYFGTSGQSYWDHKLKGSLDEVSIYGRALNSSEIASIYTAGTSGKCKIGISSIPNQRTFPSAPPHPIPFTVFNAQNPTVTATALDNSLVPTNGIVLGGSGNIRTITITPSTNIGTTTILVTAGDQNGLSASTSFSFSVGTFSELVTNLPSAWYGTVNWVDYDNDGYLDLFMSGYDSNTLPHTWLFHNNHDGTFSEVATPFPNLANTTADWGDFDGDGYLDLVIQGSTDPFNNPNIAWIFRNLGGTNFASVTYMPTPMGPGSVTWADLDNDGKLDLVVSAGTITFLLHNNGDGTFTNIYQLSGGTSSVGDFDNDGWLDLFLGGGYPVDARLYRNSGNNTFTDTGWFLHGYYDILSAWGDYNNDGWPDLLLSGNSTNLLFRNDSGSLTYIPTSLGSWVGQPTWGDFDNDGRLDFFSYGLVPSCCYESKIYHNAGTNDVFTDSGFNLPGFRDGGAAWGDYDNDGALDLVFAGAIGIDVPLTKLYHNDGAMPDTPPTAPGGLNVSLGPNSALLSWNAATDAEQSGGLSYNVRMGSTSGGINMISPMADLNTGFRRVPKIGNAGYRLSLLITNLPAGTYYWSVQAIDNTFKGSLFATEQSFTLPAPAITNQPQSQIVLAGAAVQFTVGATGASPITYQWSFNGTNIIGATASSLNLFNVQHNDSGSYSVLVSNIFGFIRSSNAVLVVNTPPRILAQPQNVTTIEGTPADFSVIADGDLPLAYQWFHGASAISGATNSSFHFAAVLPADAGNYFVQITNASGSTNSSVVTLNIPASAPVVVLQPQSQFAPPGLGVNATFFVTAVGTTPFSYQWRFNGANLPGATGSSLTITNVQTSDAGSYSVLITNSTGPTLSADAVLSTSPAVGSVTHFISVSGVTDFIYDDLRNILYIVNANSAILRFYLGSNAFLTPLTIFGSLNTLDLSPDGNVLAVADYTSSATAGVDLVDLNSSAVNQTALTGFSGYPYSLAFGNDGALICEVGNLVLRYNPVTGVTTRRNSVSTSSGPMTASADRSMIAIAGPGDSAGLVFTYNVANQGIDGFIWSNDYISQAPEVNRIGSLLAEPTSYGLPIFTNRHMNDFSGAYVALIGSPSGSVFSPTQDLLFCGKSGSRELRGYETSTFTESFVLDFGAAITSSRMRASRDGSKLFGTVSGGINWITWTNMAPSFETQPITQSVPAGSNATFTATVFGSPTMQYQWQRDGISLTAATNSSLTVNVPFGTPAHAYSVIAYNPFGVVISSNAYLSIISPPFVTVPPANQSVGAGSNATFTVMADGSIPLSYQWRANGTNIPGATATALTITNVQTPNAGNYVAVITNAYGTTTSSVATLTVLPNPPAILVNPQGQTVYAGTNMTLTSFAIGSQPLSYAWYSNGVALAEGGRISGSASTNLTISNIQVGDSAGYSVIVTNSLGAATSSIANVTVIGIPPAITVNPIGGSVAPGLPITLTVGPTGTPPLSYQWQLNGTDIPGATRANFINLNVGLSDYGSYHMVVTSPYGTNVSSDAVIVPGNLAAWSGGYTGTNSLVPFAASNVTSISAGNGGNGNSSFSPSHWLALRPDGSVVAWGSDNNGQTDVPPSATNIVAVAAGGTHSLALRADGTVMGWGNNANGQLNIPSTLSNVIAIAAGGAHSVALRSDGVVFAWGLNSQGQTTIPFNLNSIVAIAAGNAHTLALRSDGTLVGWGRSINERQGSPGPSYVPPDLGGIFAMAAGTFHNVALRTNGTAIVWDSVTAVLTNVPSSATNLIAVAANDSYSMALRSDGTVVGWGNYESINPPVTATNVPAAITNAVAIAAATFQGLAILSDGRPLITRQPVGGGSFVGRSFTFSATAVGSGPLYYQWRSNGVDIANATNSSLTLSNLTLGHSATYQLMVHSPPGVPFAAALSVPVPLTVIDNPLLTFWSPAPFTQTNYQGSTVVLNAGALGNGPIRYQWKFNGTDIRGATNAALVFDPILIADAGKIAVAVTNSSTSNIRTQTESVTLIKAWGYLSSDPPPTATNAIAIAVGYSGSGGGGHYLSLRSDGKIIGWGNNQYGQASVPASLSNSFVTAIAAGYQDSLALRSDGTVVAWGYSPSGATNVPGPATNVVAIACGDLHDLALRNDGTIIAWGPFPASSVPSSATNVVAISGGGNHSLVLRADGTVIGWGLAPASIVPASATNVVAISAGYDHSLALLADGTLLQWGSSRLPQPTNLNNIVAIAAGYSHSTALRADGTLVTWGTSYQNTATIPPDVRNVAQITVRGDVDLGLFGTRAPVCTVQPWDHFILAGSNALFAAKFAGAQPMSYQWQCNGTNIPGATTDSLLLTNVQLAQAGNYQLVASNSYGTGVTRSAVLTVPAPPVITVQPVGQTNVAGSTILLSVAATGSPPLSYQWRQNGSNNVGVNSSLLALSPATRTNNGIYSVLVSNPGGTTVSSNTTVKVFVAQKFAPSALLTNGSVIFLSGDSDGGLLTSNDLPGFTALASSNLVNWVGLPNALSITNGFLMLQDQSQTNYPARFYRIIEN
jgi:alpha-tubulin suppressor-like RCC1 family protein